MKIRPLKDIKLLRLVKESLINNICKGSGECLELKNISTIRKLKYPKKLPDCLSFTRPRSTRHA